MRVNKFKLFILIMILFITCNSVASLASEGSDNMDCCLASMANKEIALFLFPLLFISAGVIISDYLKKNKIYGEKISNAKVIKIKELQDRKEYYRGKKVKIAGRIMVICRKGGYWFNVNDGTGVIYVDLEKGKNFVIPAKSRFLPVIAEGILREEKGMPVIVAAGVNIKG